MNDTEERVPYLNISNNSRGSEIRFIFFYFSFQISIGA
jgi:hypothetical protein